MGSIEIYFIVFGALVATGLWADLKNNGKQQTLTDSRNRELNKITRRYNDVTQMLIDSYRNDKRSLTLDGRRFGLRTSNESLRKEYERKYNNNRQEYHREYTTFLRQWAKANSSSKYERFWKTLIIIGIATQIIACGGMTIAADERSSQVTQQQRLVQTAENRVWSAKTLPMTHLQDASRYVCNPDAVVSESTEQQMNKTLKLLDDSLGIESVVAIVNHIENKDIFRFAQEIFDIYHVGKNDRGLVIVLAYEDHLVRTHTGRSLEADLTDAECFRLQEQYLIPSMKAEQPDSGMIYLTEAILRTLQGKQLPHMSNLMNNNNNDEDEIPSEILLFMFLPTIGWIALFIFLAGRYGWLSGRSTFMANPFAPASSGSGVFIGSRGDGFNSGGGFSGGSFGGGSSGGGGATSSW